MHFQWSVRIIYRITIQEKKTNSRLCIVSVTPFEKWFLVCVEFSKKSVTLLLSRYHKGYSGCLFCMWNGSIPFFELIKSNCRKISVLYAVCYVCRAIKQNWIYSKNDVLRVINFFVLKNSYIEWKSIDQNM